MPGRLGPRFAIETLFLIALAVGAGLADLETRWIVAIMVAGWLIVALLELTSERLWATVPAWRRPNYAPAVASAPVVEASDVELAPEPEPEPDAAEPEIAPVLAEPQPEPEPEPEAAEPEIAPVLAEPEPEPDSETVIVA